MNHDKILAAEARLLAAQFGSDVDELDALLADDLVFVTHTGQIATKAMDLDAHRAGVYAFTRSDLIEREVRLLGEVAVVVSLVALAGSAGGVAFEGRFRYLRVWKQNERGWQVVAGQMGVAG